MKIGAVRQRMPGLWQATFTVDGGNRITIPGTVSGPTAHADIDVKQARGVLVHDPGD